MNIMVNKAKVLPLWCSYSNEGNRQMTGKQLFQCQVCIMSGSDRKIKQGKGRESDWEMLF